MSVVAIEDSDMGQPVACGNCNKVVVVPTSRLDSGAVLGDFVVERYLGSGGLASVYLAHQLSLDRPAAIKILHDKFARDAAFIKNFIHEARAAAQLNHPSIVQAYAVGEEDGIYYFAMEYVQGNTLKSVLSHSGRFVVDQALRIAQEIGAALDFAWNNKQLVHRDIKPDNIIITENRVVKLADLGLARVRGDILNDHSEEIFGTPQYVAPEQLLGYPADNRSDIYSLGATLFHLVTGECPYVGKTPAETARKHITDVLPSPRDIVPGIPEPVCHLIQWMMAKRPGHRHQSAAEFLEDLALVQKGDYPKHHPLKAFAKPIDVKNIEQEMKAVVTARQAAEAAEMRRSLHTSCPLDGSDYSVASITQSHNLSDVRPAVLKHDLDHATTRTSLKLAKSPNAPAESEALAAAVDTPPGASEEERPDKREWSRISRLKVLIFILLLFGLWAFYYFWHEPPNKMSQRELHEKLVEQEQQHLQREAEEADEAARAAELREQRLQTLRDQRERLRRETIPLARRHRFAQARNDYAAMAASQEAEFRDWARGRVEMLELAEKALATFRNTGTELAGMRFVAPGQIRPGQIVSIDNTTISSEIIDQIYERAQLVGERRIPVEVAVEDLELPRVIGLIDSAWSHRGGTDKAERDLMVGAYLLARGEMLEEARRRLQNARGRIAQSLLGEIDSVREAVRAL